MGQPLIEVADLIQVYDGQRVLDVEGLRINRGDVLALLGRNGSGKSTLLRMLSLLEKPASGRIMFHGRTLVSEQDRFAQRRRMAMVFQEPLLFSGTVAYNVSYAPAIRGLPRDVIAEKCGLALSLLGIERLASRRVETLSGGEAQRVSLARALAGEPEILFLDEPMANLDNPTRMAFRRDLARALTQLGATAIYVTHEINEALFLGNRIAVMSGGKIVQDAAPAEVWNHPAGAEVASLVGVEGLIPGVVQGFERGFTRVRCGDKDILSVAGASQGAKVMVCVRPEYVRVWNSSQDGEAGGPLRAGPDKVDDGRGYSGEQGRRQGDPGGDNRLYGVVSSVEPMGAITTVIVDCGFSVTAHVVGQPPDGANLRPGARVHVNFSPGHAHLIESA